jgi:GT2 family glycosyltransferase
MKCSETKFSLDILILSYAKNDYLKNLTLQTINTLLASEDKKKISFNILVIESNKQLQSYNYPNSTTIYPKQSFGFNKYINIGLKKTHNKYVCICNNDLIFHQNWATEILNAFNSDPQLYSASPYCNNNQGTRGIKSNSGIHYGYRLFKEISGWCIVIKRETFDIIGKPDNNIKFWYSDNDYANLLEKHHLKHALVSSSLVDHLDSQTISSEDETRKKRLTADEFLYFDYKWNHRNYLKYLYRKYKLLIKASLKQWLLSR